MPGRRFWLYLDCGHRVEWTDAPGTRDFPTEYECPKERQSKLRRVSRIEAVEPPSK